MLLSAVSVLVVAQSSSEIQDRLMNNPVFLNFFEVETRFEKLIYIKNIIRILKYVHSVEEMVLTLESAYSAFYLLIHNYC